MKKIAIAVLLSAFVAAPAFAADMYVGVKLGSAKNEVSGITESSSAFGVFGGYTIIQNLAVEVGYTDLGSMAAGIIKLSTLELSAVGSVPINEQFSIFGKLGMANTAEKGSGLTVNRSVATIGLGGQYKVAPTFGIRIGWDVYGFGDDNTIFKTGASNLLSISGVFKF